MMNELEAQALDLLYRGRMNLFRAATHGGLSPEVLRQRLNEKVVATALGPYPWLD